MINELFLNSCFSIIFSNNRKVRKEVYRDILHIIEFCNAQNKLDVPVVVKTKTECLKEICNLKLEDRQDDNIIDSILSSGKFSNLCDFIESKRMEKLEDHEIDDHIKQIGLRTKFMILFPNHARLSEFLESAKNNSYNSLDKFTDDYEAFLKEMYSNLMTTNRYNVSERNSTIDLINNNYNNIIHIIKEKYDSKNTVPTGFDIFDDDIFNGGFAKSRLYIFGGGSGSGKSTLMINCFLNQATGKNSRGLNIKKFENSTEKEVYVYITLENQIDETFLRLYQSLFGKTEISSLRDFSGGIEIEECIKKRLRKNAVPIIKYYKKYSIGVVDIMTILDDIESEHGKGSIKCLYVDYLDLLRSDVNYDVYRLELGFITSSLKDLAVEYNIPVITGSQLNKSIYENPSDSRSFNLGMMSESMKKVDHADFVAMMVKDKHEEGVVHARVGKNRSGVSEISIDFKVNFKHFKFLQGIKIVSKKAQKQLEAEIGKPPKFAGMNGF